MDLLTIGASVLSGLIIASTGGALRTWYQSKRNGEMLEVASERTKETLANQDKVLDGIKNDIADFRDHGSGPARQLSSTIDGLVRWKSEQDILIRTYGERIAVMETRYADLLLIIQKNQTETINTIERLRSNIATAIGAKFLPSG